MNGISNPLYWDGEILKVSTLSPSPGIPVEVIDMLLKLSAEVGPTKEERVTVKLLV